MKRKFQGLTIGLAALLILSMAKAFAVTYRDVDGTVVQPFVPLGGCSATGSCTGGGGTVAPFAFTPLTPGQHNVAIVTATALTVPSGSTVATVCAATASVKYTTDGTTTPTASIGQPLPANNCVQLQGAAMIANFKAISATGTLDVEYFK